MSLYSYIHEYDDYDSAILAAHNLQKDVAVAMFEYEQAEQLAMKKVMFESANYDVLMEEARENVFVKIGKALTDLIKKITDFLKGIFDKVFNRKKNQEREKNIAIAKQFLAKHPEQRDTIISAMERGDMELKDVAQYARDVEQVIKLAERQDLEADTLNNKVNEVCKKIDNAAPINVAKTLGTIGAAIGGVAVLYKGLGDLTGMVTDIKELAKKQQRIIEDAGKISTDVDIYNKRKQYMNDENKGRLGGKISRAGDKLMQDRADVAHAKINPIGKLIAKLLPCTRAYASALESVDRSLERFAQDIDADRANNNANRRNAGSRRS